MKLAGFEPEGSEAAGVGRFLPSPTPDAPDRFVEGPGSPSVEEVLAQYAERRGV